MKTNYIRLALGASLTALLLAGCGRPASETEPPAPPPPATIETPAPAAGETIPAPSEEVPPADSPEPAPSPAPEAPPPTEPSPVPKPTGLDQNAPPETGQPSLASMRSATPSAKISVPVDLRYRFDGEALPNQPVTLHLAAVPRVAGTHLQVSVKPVAGLQVASGPLAVQKADATAAYRQELSITRAAKGPASLRVLVTMDMPEGSGFGYFTIPLDAP